MAGAKRPRVILADDHTLLVEAFRKLLEATCEIVATVADGHALLDVASRLKPDVVVLDISMPLLNGLEAGRQVKERVAGTKLIFLTMNEDPDLAIEAIRMGASGYLLKKSAAAELFEAIEAALRGKWYVTPQIAQGMEASFIRDPEGNKYDQAITPRQRQVVQLLAEGKSMKEAAGVLNVATRTIAFHKYRVMEDLKLKTTADLIQFAMRNHILV
jgi:DNA-binding NarL/FixJ family response regulator